MGGVSSPLPGPPPAGHGDAPGHQGVLQQPPMTQSKEGASSPLPGPPSAAKGEVPGPTSVASSGVKVWAAEHAIEITTRLMPCLYGLMSLASEGYSPAVSPAGAGSGGSSGPGPSHGSQPPDAAGFKQLRQLSRRFLLLLACGLRDSHLLDHWARALLLRALCSGAGERGVEAASGEREERAGLDSPTHGAGVVGSDRGDQSKGGMSGATGQPAAVVAANTTGASPQHQQASSGALDVNFYEYTVYAIGSILLSLRKAGSCGSDNLGHGLPPGLCAALQQALSGPCTQHLTLSLGILMLHQADGGSLYGMPLPYRTGALAEALAAATQDLASGGSGAPPLRLLDRLVYRLFQRLLTDLDKGLPKPIPAMPLEGHVDLLLRLGQQAVRSAQAYRGQEERAGPRVEVIERGDVSAAALVCLQTARILLSFGSGKAQFGVGPEATVVLGTGTGAVSARGALAAAGVGAGPGAGAGAGAGPAGGAVGAGGGGQGVGRGGAGAEGAVAAAGPSGRPVAAARWTFRAAVAAETRWHRLLLDTGLWVETEGAKLAAWAAAWNYMASLGDVGEGTGALPPPAPVAGAQEAGVLPFLERILRRAGEREASGASAAGDPPLLPGLFRRECSWLATLSWLLAYGHVRQGAAFITTLRKLAVQGHQHQQHRQQRRRPIQRSASDGLAAAASVAHDKALNLITYAVQLGRQIGAHSNSCGDSGAGGDSCGSGGGGGSPAVPGGQAGAGGTDSRGLPRLQLLLWYGVRQLMPPMVQMAVANETDAGASWAKGGEDWAKAYTLVGLVLRPVTVLALQIASGSDGGSGGAGDTVSGVGGGGGGSSSSGRSSRGTAEGDSSGDGSGRGSNSGSPPAWLSSWRRVLLEEWRVVELVGSALDQVVLALGPGEGGGVIASAQIETVQALMGALCSVALAFPDWVWSAAGAPDAETQRKERQAKGSQRGGGSSSSKRGGKRAASAPAPATAAPTVWVWPTGRVVQLLSAVRVHLGMGYARHLEPELDALSKLVDLVQAGGPELPYKYDTPFVRATLKIKTDSTLVGGFRWLCDGRVSAPELLDGLLRTCSYPRCINLEGDSEAGAEGRLAACGRGCGRAWYCCRACAEAYWREGHAEACGRGAATEGQSAGCSGGVQ